VKSSRDRRLLQRLAGGDPDALRALYDLHARLLAFRLRRDGASVEETEEVLQETFLDVWRSPGSFRGESAVAGWLWGIASRKYRMLVRSEVRMRHRELKASPDDLPRPFEEGGWAVSIDASDAIGRLSQDLQDAFRAVAIEGMTVEEASDRLGVPVGTVKSRVHRARLALRKEML